MHGHVTPIGGPDALQFGCCCKIIDDRRAAEHHIFAGLLRNGDEFLF